MVHVFRFLLALSAVVGAFAAPTLEYGEFDYVLNNASSMGLERRQDHTQDYKTGGNVQFSASNNGYQVSFSRAQDFVVGRGWRTGAYRYSLFPKKTQSIFLFPRY